MSAYDHLRKENQTRLLEDLKYTADQDEGFYDSVIEAFARGLSIEDIRECLIPGYAPKQVEACEKKPLLILHVEAGVLQSAWANLELEVKLFDFDSEEHDNDAKDKSFRQAIDQNQLKEIEIA